MAGASRGPTVHVKEMNEVSMKFKEEEEENENNIK